MLQQHSSLRTIKKKLIRKALDMIRKIAEEDPDEAYDKDKKGMTFSIMVSDFRLKFIIQLCPFWLTISSVLVSCI